MKKAELIAETAAISGHSKTLVRGVLDAAEAAVKAAVMTGSGAFLFGLGKLEVRERGEKKARHMRTGEPVIVPARKVVIFKPSDSLLASANAA